MGGSFITLEGIEGCGKSTHAAGLAARLESDGRQVHLTREPGGSTIGDSVREILARSNDATVMCPETELLLFAASRAQLIRDVVRPMLDQGTIVVSDRFADSTTAYQAYARGLAMDTVLAINRFATGGVKPDMTIVLDLDVSVGFERVHARNVTDGTSCDRIEKEDVSFHRRVRDGYLEIAKRDPERVRVVDASLSVDDVAGEIWRLVNDVIV